jgi:predicted metal-binding membrane protein
VSSAALERAVSSRARPFSRWWWERGILIAGLLVATALAWRQLARMPMHEHPGASVPILLALWAVMMVAMMLPAASPMIVTFASISFRNGGSVLLRVAAFTSAYLAIWSIASAAGALAQAGVYVVASRTGATSHPLFSSGALLGAGVWQLTPLKHACLRRCRTPLGFLIPSWRPGARGAFAMGARHGIDCVLCCWALMAVMLALGTMSVAAMAMLTVLMIAEKVAPGGHHIGRAAALALVAWGGWHLVSLA